MPCALNSSRRSSSASLSFSFRLAVGSSRISSFTCLDSALAISTSCCLPTPRSVTSVSGDSLRPTLASSSLRPAVDRVQSMTPRRDGVAEEDVLGDRQQRHQRQFLVDDDDAERFAVVDVAEAALLAVDRRSRRRSCRAGRRRSSTFISVDLPAPFSPTRAWISPASHGEVDVAQRLHAGEALADAAHFQDCGHRAIHVHHAVHSGGGARRSPAPPIACHLICDRL